MRHRNLLFDLMVELPEARGALGGLCGQLAEVLRGRLQHCFVDAMLPLKRARLPLTLPLGHNAITVQSTKKACPPPVEY